MTDATADLMSALEGDEVTEPVADADGATIDRVTEWVAQVAKLDANEAEYVEAHKAAVAKLNERLAARVGAIDYQRAPLVDALETYHRARLAQDPEAKTIHTPAGKVKSTKARDKWQVEDEEAFRAWAVANLPDAVTFPDPSVNMTKAKKALGDNNDRISDGVVIVKGEAVPGLKVIEATDAERTFKVVAE